MLCGKLVNVVSCGMCVTWTPSSRNLDCYAHTRTQSGSRRWNAVGDILSFPTRRSSDLSHDSVLVFANDEAVLCILSQSCACAQRKCTVGCAVQQIICSCQRCPIDMD